MASDPKLLNWYAQFRKRYFSNSTPLPSEMEIIFDKMPLHFHGCCEEDEAGETNIIRINLAWNYCDEIARLTLLHEMNHIDLKCWSHGKRFQDGMVRLANLGAFKGLW